MSGSCRESPAEAEAVRQEDVSSLDSELILVEMLPVQDVSGE